MFRFLIPVSVLCLFISCSSMPKDKQNEGVRDKKDQAASLLEHGNNEYLWENHGSSINLYESAFRLSASVDWSEGMIKSLIAMSRSSDALGRGDDSLKYLKRAEYLLKESNEKDLSLSAANRRSEWLLFNKTPEEALEKNNKIIDRLDKSSGREAGEAWRIRAAILKRQKNYLQALDAADQALDIDDKEGYTREAASDHYIRASILSLSGNAEQAAEAMQSALALDKQIENTPAIAQDLYALGLIYEKAGDKESSGYYFRRSFLVYDSAGILTLPEGLKSRLLNSADTALWTDTKE